MSKKQMLGSPASVLAICFLALLSSASISWALGVGINYGRVADDLPDPKSVARFLASQGIGKTKIYDADPTVIKAFANSGVELIIGLPNEQIYTMATSKRSAFAWVKKSVAAYYPATRIIAIAVGNEVLTSAPDVAENLPRAMKNIHRALVWWNLEKTVKVSTPHSMSVLSMSYPPSAGEFNSTYAVSIMQPILEFLVVTDSYVMLNVYPFFAYTSNPAQVPLNYSLFLPTPIVTDSNNGLQYSNLFDAQVDSFYAAMIALKKSFINLTISVSETGWPTQGDPSEIGASIENAATYNENVVKHVTSKVGTPLKPGISIETYLFALFNENEKPGQASERNFGVYYPNMTQVYSLTDSLNVNTSASSGGVQTFCVANPAANQSSLKAALDYACGPGAADCQPLQPGQKCYNPNTMLAHASYAFNSYYQKNHRASGTCDFGGNGILTALNPSNGACIFPIQ